MLNRISFDGPGSFRMRINKRTGKVEYKKEIYDLKDQKYVKIIEGEFNGKLIGTSDLFLPSTYTFHFPQGKPDIQRLIAYDWIVLLKETKYSYDPTQPPKDVSDNFVDEGGFLPGEKIEVTYHKKNW